VGVEVSDGMGRAGERLEVGAVVLIEESEILCNSVPRLGDVPIVEVVEGAVVRNIEVGGIDDLAPQREPGEVAVKLLLHPGRDVGHPGDRLVHDGLMHLTSKLRVEPGPITAEKVLQILGGRLTPYRSQVPVVEQEAGHVFNLGRTLAERTGHRNVLVGESFA